jgi:ABC-2 type transport system permease protein
MIVPLVVALLVAKFGFNTELANLSFLSNIEWNPERIAIGALVLISGLAMTIGAIVALGAAMPTAQEAANYFGVIVILLMAPFFVMNSFIMGEKSFIVDFLSYFPPTSPIALLLRNALGTLSLNEALIGVGALAIFAAIAVWAAVRIFQFGTISYGAKVNLKNLFAKKA